MAGLRPTAAPDVPRPRQEPLAPPPRAPKDDDAAGPRFHFDRALPRGASLGARFVAVLVDFVLIAILSWAGVGALLALGLTPVVVLGSSSALEALLAPAVWLAILLEAPLNLAYFTLLEGRWGRTPGKRLARIHVERVNGGPPGYFDAFVRTLLRFLWVTPVLGQVFMGLDVLLVWRTEMDQRIGDLAADTTVVKDAREPTLAES